MKQRTPRYWSMRSYLAHLSHYKGRLVVVAVIFIISNLLIASIPIFVGQLIDALSNQQDPWLFIWLLIAASILHDITWQLANIAYRRHLLPINFVYGSLLFQHVIQKPYQYFTDKFTGKISSHVTKISQDMRDLLSEAYFAYLSQILGVFSVLVILATVNWQTAALFVVCVTMMIVIGRPILRRAAAKDRIETDVAATRSGHIVDSIGNFATVKAFQKESAELHADQQHQHDTLRASRTAWAWGQTFWWSQSIVVRWMIWPGVILMNVAFYFDGNISIGELATIISTALVFTNTVWGMIWSASQITLRLARVEEAYTHLFDSEIVTSQQPETTRKRPVLRSSIELHNVSFAYPERPDDAVLNNINLTIKRGEKIGIVGKSGSGKSTLTKLLLGYYDDFSGSVLIDGRAININDFAQIVSFVPQDTSLFHRSIADNIAYAASSTASRKSIIKAATQAQAHEFIEQLQGTYDALVGERGVKLSGGQRQRIAIARAILKDSPILILDEATSALDSESEILVQKALENLWDKKTAIVIAHRLSTIAKLDRIIVLDEGKIIESGTHSELIEQGGIYTKLWKHQSGGFIDE